MNEIKTPQRFKVCDKCDVKTTELVQYKDKGYCSKCYKKSIEYESDTFRKKYDIRNRDPRTLSWYQEAQLNVIKTYREKRANES